MKKEKTMYTNNSWGSGKKLPIPISPKAYKRAEIMLENNFNKNFEGETTIHYYWEQFIEQHPEFKNE